MRHENGSVLRLVGMAAVVVALCAPPPAAAADEVVDGKGFNPNRETLSELPFEHVDPMTGNLLLTFTDLELPGNAGFNLRIQRTYNSKIYATYSDLGGYTLGEDSWAGLGWTLHFGRVINRTSTSPGPTIEMPDGSHHPSFAHMDGNTSHFMTRDFWTYDRSVDPPVLRLPNGIRYEFGQYVGQNDIYATKVLDAFGNHVDIWYWNQTGAPAACTAPVTPDGAICQVVQQLASGQVRTVQFTFNATLANTAGQQVTTQSLATMSLLVNGSTVTHGATSITWNYTQVPINSGYTRLTSVQPPVGPAWTFGYDQSSSSRAQWTLTSVTTPNGGTVTYTYWPQLFWVGSTALYSPVLQTRTTNDRIGTSGPWQYAYGTEGSGPDGTNPLSTTITSPCGSKTKYTFKVVSSAGDKPWGVGTLLSKTVGDASDHPFQTEVFDWVASDPICQRNCPPIEGLTGLVHVPLLHTRTVQRDPSPTAQSYTTTNHYRTYAYSANRAENFSDYGRPYQTDEQGELARTTQRVFHYGSSTDPSFGSPYIVDKVESETVSVGGGDSFETSYDYSGCTAGSKGFLCSQTVYGITTTFQPTSDGLGNRWSSTDANSNSTTFTYDWGVSKNTTTPEYQIARSINVDGTVASETRSYWDGSTNRNATTLFTYDALLRVIQKQPAAGNAVLTDYDDAHTPATFVKTTRGPNAGNLTTVVTSSIDGFGRVYATANNLTSPVRTHVQYDACGRKSYESYPFVGALDGATDIGTEYAYDPINRVTRKTNTGDNPATYVTFTYTGVDVAIEDEIRHASHERTQQNWSAFGSPDDARLMGVTDTAGNATTYTYHALGGLTGVTPASGGSRTWEYYGANEGGGTPGLLKAETHPESGRASYTYYPAGNVHTRTDARLQQTSYTYDGNNRPTFIDRPSTAYDTTLAWDGSDHRTLAQDSFVTSDFAYDAALRLKSRSDTIGAQTFTTSYLYDGNDNLTKITYPSLRAVTYTPDVANRIAKVGNASSATAYATVTNYHPSGAPLSFTDGSGLVHAFTYDARYRTLTAKSGTAAIPTSLYGMTYGYDGVGNVQWVTDTRPGMNMGSSSSPLLYDSLDRLTGTNDTTGYWGGQSFSYDAIGNRTSGGAIYNQTTNRLSSLGSLSFGYDDNGNTTSDGASTYTYTPDDMVETATSSGVTTTYRYDADKQRIMKSDNSPASIDRFYAHGPGGQLLGEYAESCGGGPKLVRDYVHAGSRLIASVEPALPILSVPATASVQENLPFAFITVTLTTADGCPPPAEVTVSYQTAAGTAAAGSDYTTALGVLTFRPSGGSTQTIQVPIINDTEIESSQTFTLTLSGPTNATLGTATSTVTILDNDTPIVSFTQASSSAGEQDGVWTPAPPTVKVTTNDGNDLPVTVSVRYATTNGTATAGADYVATAAQTLSFGVGSSSGTTKTIGVTVLDDSIDEVDEAFTITLSAPVSATLGTTLHTVTILDNDPPPNLSIADVTQLEGNTGTAPATLFNFPVTLDGPSGKTIVVNYATANGTAMAGSDYAGTTGSLTFAPGATAKTITVQVTGDTTVEPDESFAVNLTAADPTNVTMLKATAVGTIQGDDIGISINDVTQYEGDSGTTPFVFTVSLSNTPTKTITVNYATSPGAALAGADYTATVGTLTFSPGVTTQPLTVLVVGETLFEKGSENFFVDLSSPVNGVLLDSQGQGSIMNDDPWPTLSVSDVAMYEDAGPITPRMGYPTTRFNFTVSLSAPTGSNLYFGYRTVDGTAVAGGIQPDPAGDIAWGDYLPISTDENQAGWVLNPLTFAAAADGSPAQSLTVGVRVLQDAAVEPDETFSLQVYGDQRNPHYLATGQATILNDDGPAAPVTVIDTLPYVITRTGAYALARDLRTDVSSGAAIAIEAHSVTLDFRGFRIDGSDGGKETTAIGVLSNSHHDITIRNGTIRGFARGIHLGDTPTPGLSGANVIEAVRAIENSSVGIWVEGTSTIVHSCYVARTGNNGGTDVFAVYLAGARAHVLDNDVIDTTAMGGVAYAIRLDLADGSQVSGNRVGNSVLAQESAGIAVRKSSGVSVFGNRITRARVGVAYEDGGGGEYTNNVTTGVPIPYVGGTDKGRNQ